MPQQFSKEGQDLIEKNSKTLLPPDASYLVGESKGPLPVAPKKDYFVESYEDKHYDKNTLPKDYTPDDEGNRVKYVYNSLLKGFGSLASGLEGAAALYESVRGETYPGEENFSYSEKVAARQPELKRVREEVLPELRKAPEKLLGASVSPKLEDKYNKEFLTSAIGGLTSSIPAMIGSGATLGAGLVLQAYDSSMESINATKEGKDLPEYQKSIFGLSTGLAQGMLERYGLSKIFGKGSQTVAKNLASKTLLDLAKKGGETVTKEVFEKALEASVKTLKQRALKVGGAALVEFETGSLQEFAQYLAEGGINVANDKPVFDPESFGQVMSRVLYAGAQEAVGGFILGGASIPFSKAENYISDKVAGATSSEDIQSLKEEIATGAKKGTTADVIEKMTGLVDQYADAYAKIPPTVTDRKQAASKIVEKEDLKSTIQQKTAEMQSVDEAFKPEIEAEINVLNTKVSDLNKEIANPSSTKEAFDAKKFQLESARAEELAEVEATHSEMSELYDSPEDMQTAMSPEIKAINTKYDNAIKELRNAQLKTATEELASSKSAENKEKIKEVASDIGVPVEQITKAVNDQKEQKLREQEQQTAAVRQEQVNEAQGLVSAEENEQVKSSPVGDIQSFDRLREGDKFSISGVVADEEGNVVESISDFGYLKDGKIVSENDSFAPIERSFFGLSPFARTLTVEKLDTSVVKKKEAVKTTQSAVLNATLTETPEPIVSETFVPSNEDVSVKPANLKHYGAIRNANNQFEFKGSSFGYAKDANNNAILIRDAQGNPVPTKETKEGFDYISLNTAGTLEKGSEVRLSVLSGIDYFKKNPSVKDDAKAIPIGIEAKIKGEWKLIGQLPNVYEKDGRFNLASPIESGILAKMESEGRGISALMYIRNKIQKDFVASGGKVNYFSSKIKKVINGNVLNLKDGSGKSRQGDIAAVSRLNKGKLVFGVGQFGKVTVPNAYSAEYESQTGLYTVAEGGLYGLITAPDGSYYPIRVAIAPLDTKSISDVIGYLDSITLNRVAVAEGDNSSWKPAIDVIDSIVYSGSKTLSLEDKSKHFYMGPRGVVFYDKATDSDIKVEFNADGVLGWDSAIKQKFIGFLSGKLRRVDIKKLNTPEYNDQIVKEAILTTDIDPVQPFFNTHFELESGLSESAAEGAVVQKPAYQEDIIDQHFKFGDKTKLRATINKEYSTWDYRRELDWFHRNLPNVPVHVLQSIRTVNEKGGINAWGAFVNGAVYLSNNAEVGTSYHEAFHAVFNMFLKDTEKQRILREAQVRHGLQDDLELEEKLAEDFRDYQLSGVNPYSSTKEDEKTIASFFKRLWETLKELFVGISPKHTTIGELFESIDSGKYATAKTKRSKKNLTNNIKYRKVDGFTPKTANEVVKSINYLFFDILNRRVAGGEIKSTIPLPSVYEDIKGIFKKIAEGTGVEEFTKIVNNFDSFREEHAKYLSAYNYMFKGTDSLEESDTAEADNQENRLFDKASTISDPKERLSSAMKEYILTLPDVLGKDKDGNWEVRKNYIGLPSFVDFNKVYSYFRDQLKNVWDEKSFIAKMEQLADINPLAAKVLSDYQNGSSNFKGKFYTTFSGYQHKYLTHVKEGSQDRIFETNRAGLWRDIKDDWKSRFEDTHTNKYISYDGGKLVLNTAKLKGLYSTYVARVGKIEDSISKEDIAYIASALDVIGISLSKDAIASVKDPAAFKTTFGDRGKGSVGFLLKQLASNKNIFATGYEGETTTLRAIAELEASLKADKYSGVFLNGNGDLVYSFNYANEASKVVTTLKNPDTYNQEIDRLMVAPFYNPRTGSIDQADEWLKDLKTSVRARNVFDLHTFDISRVGNQKMGYGDFTPATHLSSAMALYFNEGKDFGYYMEPSPADKANTYFISFIKKDVLRVQGNELSGRAMTAMYNTVLAEAARISQAGNDLKVLKDEELVENYHYAKGASNKRDRSGKAFEFNFFKELNNIGEVYDSKTRSLVGAGTTLTSARIEQMNEVVRKHVDREVANLRKDLVDFGIIRELVPAQGGQAVLENIKLDTRALDKFSKYGDVSKQLSMAIDEYAANRVLGLMQWTKLMSGDPAFYSSDLEMWKRFPQVHTPGQDTRVGEGGTNRSFNMSVVTDEKVDTDPEVLKSWTEGLKKQGVSTENIKNIIDAFYKITSTDSQGFITEERYNNLRAGYGTLTDDLNEMLSPSKPFYFKLVSKGDLIVPIQIKYSTIPLTAKLTAGNPKLDDIRQRMEATGKYAGMEKIDELIFTSANKVGIAGAGSLSDLKAVNVQRLPSEGYRMPQTFPFKEGSEPVFSTQIRKYAVGNIDKGASYKIGGEKMSGEETIGLFNEAISANVKQAREGLDKELGVSTLLELRNSDVAITEERMRVLTREANKKVQKALFKNAMRGGIDESREQALDLDGNGDFILPLSFPVFADKNEATLLSLYKDNVIKQTLPGLMAVQASDVGISFKEDTSLKPGKFNSKTNKLEAAEAVMSPHFFMSQLKKIGISAKDFMDINGNLDITKIPEDLLTSIVYRVPNQGKASAAVVKIVKFSPPDSSNICFLPSSFIAQMGFDFDFDKIFVINKEFRQNDKQLEAVPYHLGKDAIETRWNDYVKYVGKSKEVREMLQSYGIDANDSKESVERILEVNESLRLELLEVIGKTREVSSDLVLGLLEASSSTVGKVEFSNLSPIEQNTKAGRNNIIFDILEGLLTDGKSLQEAISPNTTAQLEESLAEIRKIQGKTKEAEFKWLSDRSQRYIAFSNMESSKLRGTISLQAVSHAVFTSASNPIVIDAKRSPVFDGKGYSSLQRTTDDSGRLISDNLMERQSAVLDSAKKPTAGLLNLNTVTGNVFMLLDRLGLPISVVDKFMNQPIVLEMVDKIFIYGNTASGRARAFNEVSSKYIKRVQDVKDDSSFGFQFKDVNGNRVIANTKTSDLKKWLKPEATEEFYVGQLGILSSYMAYKDTADTLTWSVANLRMDDHVRTGSTMDEFDRFVQGANVFLGEKLPIKGLGQFFDSESKSYFKSLLDNGIVGGINYANMYLPWRRPAFARIKDELASISTKKTISPEVSRDVNFNFQNYLFTHQESPFFSSSAPEEIKRILTGQDSVSVRLKRLKDLLLSKKNADPSFETPALFEELSSNPDFANLSQFQYIKYINLNSRTAVERSIVQRSWTDCYLNGIEGFTNAENLEVKRLLDDLASYSVMTSGFGYSPNSIIKVIPTSYWVSRGYGNFSKSLERNGYSDASLAEGFLDQYIRHNFTNPGLISTVPPISLSGNDGFRVEGIKTIKTVVITDKGQSEVEIPTSFTVNTLSGYGFSTDRTAVRDVPYTQYAKYFNPTAKKNYLYKFSGYADEAGTVGTYTLTETLGIQNKLFEYRFGAINPPSSVLDNKLPRGIEEPAIAKEYPNDITEAAEEIPDMEAAYEEDDVESAIYNQEENKGNLKLSVRNEELAKFKEAIKWNGRKVSALSKAIINKRIGQYNTKNGTSHFVQWSQVGQMDLFSGNIIARNNPGNQGMLFSTGASITADKIQKVEDSLKNTIQSLGLRVEMIDSLKKWFGVDAVGAADSFNKIIYAENSLEGRASLPEEVGHVYFDMLPDSNPLKVRLREIGKLTQAYQDVKNDPTYKEFYKEDIEFVDEAVGKLIADAIFERANNETHSVWSKFKSTLNKLLERIRQIFTSSKAKTLQEQLESDLRDISHKIVTGDVSGLEDKGKPWKPKFSLKKDALKESVEKQKNILKKRIEIYKNRAKYTGKEKVIQDLKDDLAKLEIMEAKEAFSLILVRANSELDAIIARFEAGTLTKDHLDNALRFSESYHDINAINLVLDEADAKQAAVVSDKAKKVKNLYIQAATNRASEMMKAYSTREAGFIENYDALDPELDLTIDKAKLGAMATSPDQLLQLADKVYKREMDKVAEKNRIGEAVVDEAINKLSTFKATKDPVKLFEDFVQTDALGQPTGRLISKYRGEFYAQRKDAQKKREGESDEAFVERVQKWFSSTHNVEGEYAVPKDKWVDPKWTRVHSTPELKAFYNFYTDRYRKAQSKLPRRYFMGNILPSLKAGYFELARRSGLSGVFRHAGDELKSVANFEYYNDTRGGMYDENGNPVDLIPVFFTGKIKEEVAQFDPVRAEKMVGGNERTIDLGGSLKTFMFMANNFEHLSNIREDLELLRSLVKERPHYERDAFGNIKYKTNIATGEKEAVTKPLTENLALERFNSWMNMIVYGRLQTPQAIGNFDVNKASNALMKYTSLQRLAFNVIGGPANAIVGGALQVMEAIGGQFYGVRDYIKATAIYTKELGTYWSDDNKLKAVVKELRFLQHQSTQYGNLSTASYTADAFNRLMSTDMLFFIQFAGEHEMQCRAVIAMMIRNGIWDKISVKDGKIKWPKDWDRTKVSDFRNKSIGVLQSIHGRYTVEDRAALQEKALGRLVMQFRLWLYPGIERRYGKRQYNERVMEEVEGNYRSAYRFVKGVLSYKSVAASWEGLDAVGRAGVRKTLAELGYVIALSFLVKALERVAKGLADEDDDHINYMAYQASRLSSEIRIFQPEPFGAYKAAKQLIISPAASIGTIEDMGQFIYDVYELPFRTEKGKKGEKGNKFTRGINKDEYRAYVSFRRLIPIWNQFERPKSIDEQYQMFKHR